MAADRAFLLAVTDFTAQNAIAAAFTSQGHLACLGGDCLQFRGVTDFDVQEQRGWVLLVLNDPENRDGYGLAVTVTQKMENDRVRGLLGGF